MIGIVELATRQEQEIDARHEPAALGPQNFPDTASYAVSLDGVSVFLADDDPVPGFLDAVLQDKQGIVLGAQSLSLCENAGDMDVRPMTVFPWHTATLYAIMKRKQSGAFGPWRADA